MQQRERREMMIYEVVEGERASQQVRQASRQAGRRAAKSGCVGEGTESDDEGGGRKEKAEETAA